MILECRKLNDSVIATILVKEANLTNSELLKTEIIQLIENGEKLIIINFEKVEYVDSSFLGSLVVVLKFAIKNQAEIYLVSLNKDISNLLNLIRMDKVFKIFRDTNEALKSNAVE